MTLSTTIQNKDGHYEGKIVGGSVYNWQDIIIGYVELSGSIKDYNLNVLGKVNKDGAIIDSQGIVLGYANQYGAISNSEGELIGKVMGILNKGTFFIFVAGAALLLLFDKR